MKPRNWDHIDPETSGVQTFASGATRSSDAGKNDYEGYLNPKVLEAYGDYMTRHRTQADGRLRDSDNWQKGMPLANYLKSFLRHGLDLWKLHRGYRVIDQTDGHEVTIMEACCAITFNVFGYMNETLKGKVSEHLLDDILETTPF